MPADLEKAALASLVTWTCSGSAALTMRLMQACPAALDNDE